MIALFGGLIAALSWGTSTLFAGKASRQIGPASTLAWVAITGVVIMTPVLIWFGPPQQATITNAVLVAIAAVGSVLGLRLTYSALARGKVGVVVAITSTEGAVAAVIALAMGEQSNLLMILGLVAASGGVAAVGLGRHSGDSEHAVRDNRRAAMTAGAASVVFGSSLWAAGSVAVRVGGPWVVFSSRLLGLFMIALPLIIQRRLQMERPGVYLACSAGVLEVIGFLGFVWGAGAGLAVAAVVATQYATIAILLSRIVFKERLSPVQIGGVAVVLVGVILIAGSKAI